MYEKKMNIKSIERETYAKDNGALVEANSEVVGATLVRQTPRTLKAIIEGVFQAKGARVPKADSAYENRRVRKR